MSLYLRFGGSGTGGDGSHLRVFECTSSDDAMTPRNDSSYNKHSTAVHKHTQRRARVLARTVVSSQRATEAAQVNIYGNIRPDSSSCYLELMFNVTSGK